MIPQLYENTATNFTYAGICALYDCISCTVTEERNGAFYLEMQYPKDGTWTSEIVVDRIILAEPYDGASMAEPFRITEVEFKLNGILSISAVHISYQLNDIICGAYTDGTRYPAKEWQILTEGYLLTDSNPFSFTTDMTDSSQTVHTYSITKPTSMRSILGGMDGSFLDLYGGELLWNRYTVSLLSARGSDNGVKIAYAKNLTGLTYDVDISDVYTGVVAYYSSGDNYVEGTLQTVTNTYSFNRVKVVDATSEFDSVPSSSDLDTWAASYVAENAPDPVVSVDVEFVPLWQTDEYEAYYDLEHVSLCDTVEVIYPPLDLDLSAKVVKTEYDVLAERYTKISISTAKPTLADTIFALM